jgi:hypothetical protein
MPGAVRLYIKPGIHPVPDAGPGMVPSSPGIGQVKHPGKIHIQIRFAHNAQGLVIMGLPQVQVVDAGQGAAVHADGGRGRQIPQLCQVGLKILPGPAIF